MIQLKGKLNRYDDALDVFGVHACGGMWGALATGLFANSAVNSALITQTKVRPGMGVSNRSPFSGAARRRPGASLSHRLKRFLLTVIMAVVSTVLIGSVVKVVCGGLRAPADPRKKTAWM